MKDEIKFKLEISESAFQKIHAVLQNKAIGSFFRIDISSGGCAGFSSSFRIDNIIEEHDLVIEKKDIKVVINQKVAEFIKEAELKYNTDILSSYFNLDVKTATNTCSCGSSFSL